MFKFATLRRLPQIFLVFWLVSMAEFAALLGVYVHEHSFSNLIRSQALRRSSRKEGLLRKEAHPPSLRREQMQ